MKLTVNFASLQAAVQLMEPNEKGSFSLDYELDEIEKITTELEKGIAVPITEVDFDGGLLGYQGHQVLLYIKANGRSARFHVADCKTLKSMRDKGRFERYVVSNDTSGNFAITAGYDIHGKEIEDTARLKVCQNCLRQLNYQGCNSTNDIRQIVRDFDLNEFFSTYSSFFPHMPQRTADNAPSGYTEDWSKVSIDYRVENGFQCEQCHVHLKNHRSLLHVHHISGVKSDNSEQNLIALCADCHSKQPLHDRMFVSHEQRITINKLRKEQGLLENITNWESIFGLADPGLHGVLHFCRDFGTSLPELNVYVGDSFGEIVAKVEVAWPNHKLGVAISSDYAHEAASVGWTILSSDEFLNSNRHQLYKLRS